MYVFCGMQYDHCRRHQFKKIHGRHFFLRQQEVYHFQDCGTLKISIFQQFSANHFFKSPATVNLHPLRNCYYFTTGLRSLSLHSRCLIAWWCLLAMSSIMTYIICFKIISHPRFGFSPRVFLSSFCSYKFSRCCSGEEQGIDNHLRAPKTSGLDQ